MGNILFHASWKDHVPGVTLTAPVRPHFGLPSVGDPGTRRLVDCLLDASRPPGAPNRSDSVYAAESAALAFIYLAAQNRSLTPNVYEVRVSGTHRAAMALVQRVAHLAKGSAAVPRSLLDEYWSPDSKWKVIEHLCARVEVLGVVDIGSLTIQAAAAHISYGNDVNLAKRLWP